MAADLEPDLHALRRAYLLLKFKSRYRSGWPKKNRLAFGQATVVIVCQVNAR